VNIRRLKDSSISIIVLISAIVWVLSTLIDSSMTHGNMMPHGTFLDLLIFNIPEMQLFHRILYILIAAFISSILLLYKAHYKLKESENKLADLNKTLEQRVIERTEELTKINTKLENLNNSKSDILGLLSHELKTPINGIMGASQLLLFELENSDNRELAQDLFDSSKRLNNFCETALLVTKLKLREHNLKPLKIDLEDFIKHINMQFYELNSSNSLVISKKFEQENIYVEIDENLIDFSINSILKNSIKYSNQDSEINLIFSIEQNFLKLCFQDNGTGFSEEIMPRIFELFSFNDLMHHSEGLGLSLAIVKLIMEYHNGKVEAKNVESGAEVSLYLPLSFDIN
jgi:signal transduction histidine kinase